MSAPLINRRDFGRGLCGIALAAVSSVQTGCGYMVGGAYGPQVRSVNVPIFQNNTYRRNIEFQLTEAIQKEIKSHTSFRLVNNDEADTRLSGRIVEIRKNVLGENSYDDPRELQLSLMVHVTWEDLRSGEVLARQETPLDADTVPLAVNAEFAPEMGQSLATATNDVVDRMARRIVNMMEQPW